MPKLTVRVVMETIVEATEAAIEEVTVEAGLNVVSGGPKVAANLSAATARKGFNKLII
jgi:hypothetical protein